MKTKVRGDLVGILVMLLVFWLLGGCASTYKLEVEHISHPMVGPPFEGADQEDAVTQLVGLAGWGGVGSGPYVEAGLGANLRGSNGGGFYGPPLTFTARAGYVWRTGK
jgi:hypothetical protein